MTLMFYLCGVCELVAGLTSATCVRILSFDGVVKL